MCFNIWVLRRTDELLGKLKRSWKETLSFSGDFPSTFSLGKP